MIKQILMGKKIPEKSLEEFKKYYIEEHAPLIMKTLPQVRKYTLNFPIGRPGKENIFDFVTEVWWDDVDAARNFFKSDLYKNVIQPDEVKLGILSGQGPCFEEFVQK